MSVVWPDVPAMLSDEEGKALVARIHARNAWPYADESSPQMVAWDLREKSLTERLDRARTKAPAPARSTGDVAEVNIPSTPKRWGALESDIDQAVAAVEAGKELESAEAAHTAHQSRKPVPFTRAQLDTATVVRTEHGWNKVRKANAKSVTVEAHFGPELVPLDKVLEVRS